MLVLTRKVGEAICIGDDVKITITSLAGGKVRLGIEAPKSVAVHRKEVADEIAAKKATEETLRRREAA